MNGVYKAGFTIIETMLFLGITGLLVLGILAGAGASINVQRYHDSVSSVESVVQGLYTSVDDVVNDRGDSASCAISGSPGAVPVGQSDCVVIGQYMAINGNDTSISTVLGYSTNIIPDPDTPDTQTIKSYTLSLLDSSTVKSVLDWGATIKPSFVGILIIRSPSTGLNYTYTTNKQSDTLTDMVDNGITTQQTVCIVPGTPFNGGLALVIDPAANDAADVQVRSNTTPLNKDGARRYLN
jgi:type II secretory pathway pseudopilin PulG